MWMDLRTWAGFLFLLTPPQSGLSLASLDSRMFHSCQPPLTRSPMALPFARLDSRVDLH